MLIDTINYLLGHDQIKGKSPRCYILFNDIEKKNIENLKAALKNFSSDYIQIVSIKNQPFADIIAPLVCQLKKGIAGLPKFFFLDPFTYSDIRMSDLKKLMNLDHTEVLLFLPAFLSYRFASDKTMKDNHKTRVFLEEFTTNGVYDYKENNEGIEDFLQSMKEKLVSELQLDYVRPMLLDDGRSKNALILLTKNQKGMLVMNKIAFQESDDGKGICIRQRHQKTLFGASETKRYNEFRTKFTQKIAGKVMTNSEIVDFAIKEEFLPKHIKEILKEFHKSNILKVHDEAGQEISSPAKWNIAEEIKKKTYFYYYQ